MQSRPSGVRECIKIGLMIGNNCARPALSLLIASRMRRIAVTQLAAARALSSSPSSSSALSSLTRVLYFVTSY